MPLARYAPYAQDIEIYVAPTWDAGENWIVTMPISPGKPAAG
jgi:nitrilase